MRGLQLAAGGEAELLSAGSREARQRLGVGFQVQIVASDDGDEHVIDVGAVAAKHALRLHHADRAEKVGAVRSEVGVRGHRGECRPDKKRPRGLLRVGSRRRAVRHYSIRSKRSCIVGPTATALNTSMLGRCALRAASTSRENSSVARHPR